MWCEMGYFKNVIFIKFRWRVDNRLHNMLAKNWDIQVASVPL